MEVLTVSEMTRADQIAIANGTSGFALMREAGKAVADVAEAMAEHHRVMLGMSSAAGPGPIGRRRGGNSPGARGRHTGRGPRPAAEAC